MSKFSPMLALSETPADLNDYQEHLPLLGSYKLDGIRSIDWVHQVSLSLYMASRSLKPIPSAYAQQTFPLPHYKGLDGELLIKPRELPEGETIYHATYSAVMTHGCTEPLDWWIFDHVQLDGTPYTRRQITLEQILKEFPHPDIKILEQRVLNCVEDIAAMEQEALDGGYEGLIVRRPDAKYHCNRSSWKQGYLMKVVRKLTSTARIVDITEMMHNDNEAKLDARGYTVRSSHKANLRTSGMLGAFIGEDVTGKWPGLQFKCGLGKDVTHQFREEVFREWPKRKGDFFDYEYKPYGTKHRPRQPQWTRWRSPIDLSM